jgi:hypothetical protein
VGLGHNFGQDDGSEIIHRIRLPCMLYLKPFLGMGIHTISIVIELLIIFMDRFVDGLSDLDLRKAQLGLAHSYSRAKVALHVP